MRRPFRALFALLAALAGPALAGNGILAITTTYTPNTQGIAVKAIVTGDDDSNAVLRIFHRQFGAGTYDTGMVMVRRIGFGPNGQTQQATGNVYEGRILWMDPSTPEEFYVEGKDPGGNFSTTAQTVFAFAMPQIDASGPVFYVRQRTGNDNNDGSFNYPFKTLTAAHNALMAAPNNGKHGGIFVGPGEYHERMSFAAVDFPSDGGPWFVEGEDPTQIDSTIICGANEMVERGFYAPGKPIKWVNTMQDSTWKCYFPGSTAGSSPGDSTQLVVLGWGEQLHRKLTLRGLLNDSTYVSGCGSTSNYGELSGWLWQNDTLYVKRRNGKSPAGMVMHTGYRESLFQLGRKNIRIANLTFRFAGGVNQSDPGRLYPAYADPSFTGNGIAAGAIGTCDGLAVDSCKFYGFNAPALYTVRGNNGAYTVDGIWIEHCTFDGLTVGSFGYAAGKCHTEEVAAQVFFRTKGSTFAFNTITGTFNGLGTDAGAETDSTTGMNNEIMFNEISNTADDALELDDNHDINTLVLGNNVHDCGDGISICPVWNGGPLFVFQNLFTNCTAHTVKGGLGGVGIVQFVNNTMVSNVPAERTIDFQSGGTIDQTLFVNNLISSFDDWAIWNANGAGLNNVWNWDDIYRSDGGSAIYWDGVTQWTLTGMQIFGYEANGLQNQMFFADSTSRNYLPRTNGGFSVDLARRWTGLHNGINGAIRYVGPAPDKGAIERWRP